MQCNQPKKGHDLLCLRPHSPAVPPSPPPSLSPPGIRWHKCNRKWEVQIKYRGKKLSLGYFDDELAAAQCYDRRAKELYETPLLNFLVGGKLNPDRKRRVDPRSLRYASFPFSLPPSGHVHHPFSLVHGHI